MYRNQARNLGEGAEVGRGGREQFRHFYYRVDNSDGGCALQFEEWTRLLFIRVGVEEDVSIGLSIGAR
jgi:hypothetical protein